MEEMAGRMRVLTWDVRRKIEWPWNVDDVAKIPIASNQDSAFYEPDRTPHLERIIQIKFCGRDKFAAAVSEPVIKHDFDAPNQSFTVWKLGDDGPLSTDASLDRKIDSFASTLVRLVVVPSGPLRNELDVRSEADRMSLEILGAQ
jgi:hypothetical protein